ncbi:probable chitinase 2 [Leptidea sinapis]|uniref:probable chitinase 2 n=1 Tax=Leptidea sinapis TaxID=189913 RepID=UPI002121660A|nr:probable chitinase 2 [Leptidea sinapis]
MAGGWCLFFLISSVVVALDGQTLGPGPAHNKVVVCYVATWAVYRSGDGKFELSDLDPSLCTHLIYSFAGLDESSHSIKSLDPWQDLEKDYGRAGYKRIVALKETYPHLKVTVAIGGWNEGSEKYSNMAADPELRAKFIQSVLYFLDTNKFDGLDLDWEYPGKRGGKAEDKANYVSLVKELNEAFQSRGYLLTAAMGVGKDTMDVAYDLAKLSRYLDFIHMMCYDYHGTWDGVVGANAPLRGMNEADVLSVEYTTKYMMAHGVSPYKMVLGLPMYGRTFVLENPGVKSILFGVTAAKSVGFPGPFTKENGFMGYNEICRELTNSSSTWIRHWHEQTSTPYLRDGSRVISYDNERSIALKVKMAIDYGLGGLMVWSIDTDNFKGRCEDETDTFIDFEDRYRKIVDEPILARVLKTLHLPDANHVEHHGRRAAYTVSDNRLELRVPDNKYPNYNLMRTINEATLLALEEKRIMDEIDLLSKQNEIDDSPDSAIVLSSSLLCLWLCVLPLYI